MVETFLVWLEAGEPVTALRRSIWAYPVVSWLHLIGIGLLFGTIVTVDLCLIGVLKSLDWERVSGALVPIAVGAFVLAAITGLMLFAPAGREYLANPYFIAKVILMAIAGGNALLARVSVRQQFLRPRLEAAFGLASIALWISVIFTGRMLAFG